MRKRNERILRRLQGKWVERIEKRTRVLPIAALIMLAGIPVTFAVGRGQLWLYGIVGFLATVGGCIIGKEIKRILISERP